MARWLDSFCWVHSAHSRLVLIKTGRGTSHYARVLSDSGLASHFAAGFEEFAEVKRAFLEPDGHLSVIRYSKEDKDRPSPKQKKSTIA